MCMRTNIVLNNDLVKEAFKYSQAGSKRALVEEALRVFIEVRAHERRAALYRSRIDALDRRMQGVVFRDKPSAILRADRERIA
jgi:Arc/MetJ family transcription regulator